MRRTKSGEWDENWGLPVTKWDDSGAMVIGKDSKISDRRRVGKA